MTLYRVPLWRIKPRRFEHPLAPRLKRGHVTFHRSTHMADVTIPVTAPTTRKDGSALAATDIAQMDFELSSDNGATYTNVGHAAANQTEFKLQALDPGSYLVRATATDTQNPPLTSDFSPVVAFQIAAPALAAPNPPTLGTPVVS
jgi:hypothetical protein